MSKKIEEFFDRLFNDNEAKDYLADKKPQTFEDFAKVSGGLAEKYGFDLSEEDILLHLQETLSKVKGKSDDAAAGLAALDDSAMEAVAAGQMGPNQGGDRPPMPMPECGMPELAVILKKISEYGKNGH